MLKKALLEYYLSRRLKSSLVRASGDAQVADLLQILESQQERCAECTEPFVDLTFEVDHIKPVHLGGLTERQNLQYLCRGCHALKTARQRVYRKTGWKRLGKGPIDRDEGRRLGRLLLR